MRLILSVFILLFGLASNAQFRYHFETFPSDAEVTTSFSKSCKTPCEIDFYWRDAVDGMIVFNVKKEGYYSFSDTILKKPRKFDFYYNEDLKRVLPEFEFDTITPLVIFDRLVVNFRDGQEVGSYKNKNDEIETIKWEGATRVGKGVFENLFYEIATNANITTPVALNAELFEESRNMPPRFLIGVEILDFDVSIDYTDSKKYQTKVNFHLAWKVKDRVKDEVVLEYKNFGKSSNIDTYLNFRKINIDAYKDALIDFVNNEDFFELLNSAEHRQKAIRESTKDKLILDSLDSKSFDSFSSMISYASLSCVTIETESGHGSGFFIDQSGLILTSNHVVENNKKLKVHLKGGISLDAELISNDKAFDIAIIKVPGSGYQPLKLNNFPTDLGQDVSTIGTPTSIELGQSLSKGVISGQRKIEDKVFTQLNISVSPGNSGGPLLNENGEVVGIITSKLIGEGIEGVAFAVPTKKIVQKLNVSY